MYIVFYYFFCIYWDDHMIFIFHFVNVVYHTDWVADVESSLYLWEKSHLIMGCMILLMYYWIWFLNILLRIFPSVFIKDAAAAKSLQSCPTLCDRIPGILQARTLERVAISFSNA